MSHNGMRWVRFVNAPELGSPCYLHLLLSHKAHSFLDTFASALTGRTPSRGGVRAGPGVHARQTRQGRCQWTVTRRLGRILPVAVPRSGLVPPYTEQRLGSGRLKMYRYANLNGLELLDRAQRHSEDRRICRLRGPPSGPSQPIALGFLVPLSFRLSLSFDPLAEEDDR
jgi:hypothetical protein